MKYKILCYFTYMLLILSLMSITSCGLIFPNTAEITIKNGYDNSTLKVYVNYDSDNTESISSGNESKFSVNWWGDYRYALPIHVNTIINDVSINTEETLLINNFDKLTYVIGGNDNKKVTRN